VLRPSALMAEACISTAEASTVTFFIPFYASRLQLLSKFSGIRRAVELSVTFILSEVHATGALDYTM